MGKQINYPRRSSTKYIYKYLKDKKVLDIGCRVGVYLETFSKDSIGIDIDDSCIKICEDKGLKVKKVDLNKGVLPFENGEFEVVFCSHVLEHVNNPINLLKEIKRVLSFNGILIVGLPIEGNLISAVINDDYYLNHPGHIYSFSVKGSKALLNRVGFKLVVPYFDLPKCRGKVGGFLLDIFQYAPISIKELIAPAYWWVCTKVESE